MVIMPMLPIESGFAAQIRKMRERGELPPERLTPEEQAEKDAKIKRDRERQLKADYLEALEEKAKNEKAIEDYFNRF